MNEIIITPLGTVSPYCKDSMNCPGFLIETSNSKILLDCGNGITRYLNFPKDLNNLNVIITHYHKDHFMDISCIQYASYVYHNLGLLNNKINVYLPKHDYNCSKESIISSKECYCRYFEISNELSIYIDDIKITFHDNKSHNICSYMIKLEYKDFNIVYTSDIGTNNFDDLIDFCRNSDIIICESSFLKKHNSKSINHLTAYDASILAKKSNTKKLLLTHFWPEEDKNLYLEEALLNFKNSFIAYEGENLILRRK